MSANRKGFLLLELVIASALILLVFVTLFYLQSKLLEVKQDGIAKAKAVYYAEEAMEAVRYIREYDPDKWAAISILPVSTDYWIDLDTNQWTLVASDPGLTDGSYTFDRRVRFETVYRDPAGSNLTGQIQASGTADPGARRVVVTVSWSGGAHSVTLETIITDWHSLL